MLRIEEIKLSLKENENILKEKISKIIGEKVSDIQNFKIIKKAIDSRNKRDILFVYSINIEAEIKNINPDLIKKHRIREIEEFVYEIKNPSKKPAKNPIIIGSGPAGLFCALVLVKAGLKPIVIERGKDVDNRIKDVEEFSNTGKLNTNSNIQFGEGGAGTFSDGKL
ncbi:MAG: NAD(P)/FAD-dependent oxidoreductase, partial [Candidatus Gracilibacteria bacterium]|nr:NAD(P)/FAD-dependent oxidoreductase [Candidatus Gracilibacteria bacterium]